MGGACYKEIFRLKEMLEKAEIPFEFGELYDGYQICYPKNDEPEKEDLRVCSVVEHLGSYGHTNDKLEIMGLLTDEESQYDEVVGYLSAENVFERIWKHYKNLIN